MCIQLRCRRLQLRFCVWLDQNFHQQKGSLFTALIVVCWCWWKLAFMEKRIKNNTCLFSLNRPYFWTIMSVFLYYFITYYLCIDANKHTTNTAKEWIDLRGKEEANVNEQTGFSISKLDCISIRRSQFIKKYSIELIIYINFDFWGKYWS